MLLHKHPKIKDNNNLTASCSSVPLPLEGHMKLLLSPHGQLCHVSQAKILIQIIVIINM